MFSDAELESKLAAAQHTFASRWRWASFDERRAVVARAAALMRLRAEPLARLVTLELGKLIAQNRGAVALSAAILDHHAEHAQTFLGA